MSPWRFHWFGEPAAFEKPVFLLGVLFFLFFGALFTWTSLRRKQRISKVIPETLAQVLAPAASPLRPLIRTFTTHLAFICFAVALAQPQCGNHTELTKKKGIDVVVAIDASKSMLAKDVQPCRLERAKLELFSLLDELKGDRVAIVAFAGDAFIQCPLTSDYAAAKLFLRAIDPNNMPQGGTNIGDALLLSRQVLESADRGAKEKVVILLSDGEDLSQDIRPGLDALKEIDARVMTVGIGSDKGEPIPLIDKNGRVNGYQKDDSGNTILSKLDRAGLEHIAAETGGEFFYEPNSVATSELISRIDKMQKSELESRVTVKYSEMYQPYILAGLVLFVLSVLLQVGVDLSLRVKKATSTAGILALFLALSLPGSARAMGIFEKNHPRVAQGMQAFSNQEYDAALQEFDAALAEHPQDPVLHYDRAAALHKLGRHQDAQTALTKAAELDKGQLGSKIHYNMGNIWNAMEKRDEALLEYRKALRADPSDAMARHNMEVLLQNQKPPPPQSPDGGMPDGGPSDAGKQDGGTPQGGSDGGRSGDGGTRADGGTSNSKGDGKPDHADAGQGDGGQSTPQSQGKPEKQDAGMGSTDGGSLNEEQIEVGDGGVSISKADAEKLLDAMKNSERNLQLWRFQKKSPKKNSHEKDW